MSHSIDGHEIVARFLAQLGVEHAFGLLGDANVNAFVHATALGIEFHGAWHEGGAVSMAAGYALSSGRVGVATVTKGPGLANTLTALTSAVRDRAPIVLLAGETGESDSHRPTSPAQRFEPQEFDHAALAELAGAVAHRPTDVEDLLVLLPAVFEASIVESRPHLLLLPNDIMNRTIDDEHIVFHPFCTAPSVPSRASSEAIAEAAALLSAADRPVILAGLGATHADAIISLIAIAEQTGAVLTTSLPAAGAFAGDPFALGPCGGYAEELTRELVMSADVVLVAGASLNPFTTDKGTLFEGATVIQIDVDASAIGRQLPADLALVGDSRIVAEQLRAALVGVGPRTGLRTADLADRIARQAHYSGMPARSDDLGVDPRAVLRAVDHGVAEPRRFVIDLGHFSTFPAQVLRPRGSRRLLPTFGFAAIGLGLGTAIGAAVADTSVTTVLVVGDGGLAISLPELLTVATSGVPIVVVVLNDRAYGAEVHMLRKDRLPESIVQFPAVDLAAIARSMGISALTVTSDADLDRVDEVLAAASGPLLIDAHITPAVIADKFARAAAVAHTS